MGGNGQREGGCGSFNPFHTAGVTAGPQNCGRKKEKSRGSRIQSNMAHWYNSCLTEMLERFLSACAQHREHVGLNSGCTGGFEE